jgi:hypothetical protein
MPLWHVYHPVGAYTEQEKREFAGRVTDVYQAAGLPLFWLLGRSVHEIRKMRRDNLSSSTSPAPRDTPPSNVRSNKTLLHTFESTDFSNETEG